MLDNVILELKQEQLLEANDLIFSSYHKSDELNLTGEWEIPEPLFTCFHRTFGVFIKGELTSTMTVTLANNLEEVQHELYYYFDLPFFEYPTAIFKKGATHFAYQGKGLNSLIRFHLLKLMFIENIPNVIGILPLNSRRTNFLQSMGYTIFPLDNNSSLTNELPQLVILKKQNYDKALIFLRGKIPDLILEFTF